MVMALKQLVCPQSAIHGWSGLVIDLVMYALIKLPMSFVLVTDPGIFPTYNNFATKAAIKMTNKRFKRDKNYLLHTSTEGAFACSMTTSLINSRYPTLPT
jgi:hypothetical protein